MPWRTATQVHIFVPTDQPYSYDNWVEQVLGSILRPLHEEYGTALLWCWFTRHISGRGMGDQVPESYFAGGLARYITLRLAVADDKKAEIIGSLMVLAKAADCHASDLKHYDPMSDLGGQRYVRPDASDEVREARARTLLTLLDATTRLMVDALVQDTRGNWTLEPNADSAQNPRGSLFESVHHLFCNATGVPTDILLSRENDMLKVSTYWMAQATAFIITDDDDFQVRLNVQY